MLNTVVPEAYNPFNDIQVNTVNEYPLWQYVVMALNDISTINVLSLYRTEQMKDEPVPFVDCVNFSWNPHPVDSAIYRKRRETGDKVQTKSPTPQRIGILSFDFAYGSRDKNKKIVKDLIHNQIYIPIEDDKGRYLIDNILYQQNQMVDKLLYPSGADSITLKSLLPIVINYGEPESIVGSSGLIVTAKIPSVKIFNSMEPIISCFMHIPLPLSYLCVYPILEFVDHKEDDLEEYEYFQPCEDVDYYIKAYRDGLETFEYVRMILLSVYKLIESYKPQSYAELVNPHWWIYESSKHENMLEHRGAIQTVHVSRMLDTISALSLPIPENDKRTMVYLLRYVLQTKFSNINIYSLENKRFRRNEIISTIITAEISAKLKKMFGYGIWIPKKEIEPTLHIRPDIIIKNLYKLQTIHTIDFANDMDFIQQNKYTRKGPNSIGRTDSHKITQSHKQLHPSTIGIVDMLDSPKDVGQTGTISPYANTDIMQKEDRDKYPNIKYLLFSYIQDTFKPKDDIPLDDNKYMYKVKRVFSLNCENALQYEDVLDHLLDFTEAHEKKVYYSLGDKK